VRPLTGEYPESVCGIAPQQNSLPPSRTYQHSSAWSVAPVPERQDRRRRGRQKASSCEVGPTRRTMNRFVPLGTARS
jgi:hypothetical protein